MIDSKKNLNFSVKSQMLAFGVTGVFLFLAFAISVWGAWQVSPRTNAGAAGAGIMVFSSPMFLFLFLPAVLGLYVLAGRVLRNLLLFVASLFFYAWGEPTHVWILILCILGNYVFGRRIQARREETGRAGMTLAWGLAFNLSLLIFFKYINFIAANINYLTAWAGPGAVIRLGPVHLPIGISFFTFQAMTYLLDVYRGICVSQPSLLKLGLYISMFPQLIAGPIVRYQQIARDLDQRSFTLENWSEGIRRFVLGLGKKVLIANTVGAAADKIMALPGTELYAGLAWLGVICYTLQIYYDFSGYSDMAIGLGRIFGFSFPENFNYPYFSQSVREFWRRWHMTLSSWFKDYLYFPLGGSRLGKGRTYVNLFIVFLLCGIWHGASWNYLIWGLYHGLFLVLERTAFGRLVSQAWRPLRHLYLLGVVMVGWVFFRIEDLPQALDYLRAMCGLHGAQSYLHPLGMYLDRELWFVIVLGVLGSAPLLSWFFGLCQGGVLNQIGRGLRAASFALVLILSVIYMAGSTYNPFIYFRF